MTILLYYTAALEGDLMQWVTAVKSQQSLHKSTANRQYPAGTHMEWWWGKGGWGVSGGALSNCHLDVTRLDRKGRSGRICVTRV